MQKICSGATGRQKSVKCGFPLSTFFLLFFFYLNIKYPAADSNVKWGYFILIKQNKRNTNEAKTGLFNSR